MSMRHWRGELVFEELEKLGWDSVCNAVYFDKKHGSHEHVQFQYMEAMKALKEWGDNIHAIPVRVDTGEVLGLSCIECYCAMHFLVKKEDYKAHLERIGELSV